MSGLTSRVAGLLHRYRRFIRFALVGGFGTLLNTGILYLLTYYAGLHYLLSAAIATEAAIVSNFFGNQLLTFRDVYAASSLWKRFGSFQMISLATVFGSLAILWALATFFGQGYVLVWNLVAIFTMFLVNFMLNARFTWKAKQNSSHTKKAPAALKDSLLVFMVVSAVSVAVPFSYAAVSGENTSDVASVDLEPGASSGSYRMQETGIATFSLDLEKAGKVDWYVDGVIYSSSPSSTRHVLKWTPGIMYTSGRKEAVISAMAQNRVFSWNIDVYDSIDVVFSKDYGDSETSLDLYISDSSLDFGHIDATIVGMGSVRTLRLEPVGDDESFHWRADVGSTSYGTTYVTRIYGRERNSGRLMDFRLTTERSHYREFPFRYKYQSEGAKEMSRDSYRSFMTEEPVLVYVIFTHGLVRVGQSQKVVLDAKNIKGGVDYVTAGLVAPDGSLMYVDFGLTGGSQDYGTWSADFTVPVKGKYVLQSVTLAGGGHIVKVPADASFYAEDSSAANLGPQENVSLKLVYTTLNASQVRLGADVLLTLDAQDTSGISAVSAVVAAGSANNLTENMTVGFTLVDGDATYGTWQGVIRAKLPDTTYAVTSVTLSSSGFGREYPVGNRQFYVEALPPPPTAGAAVTAEELPQVLSAGNVARMMQEPLAPTFLGFMIMALIMAGALISGRVR